MVDAKTSQEFIPIFLLNVSYKITKVLAVRLRIVIDDLISATQTPLIKDRYIMEGVVLLHETIHEIQSKKEAGVLMKIDLRRHMVK